MHCPACGVEVVEAAVYCHKCGQRLLPAEDGPPRAGAPAEAGKTEATEVAEPATLLRREAQDEPEEELWRGGYSSRAMSGAWIASGLVSLVLLVVGILWARTATWWLILMVAIILPWLYSFAVLCYRRMSVHYLLTTQRFIHESGVLRRLNNRIEVLDIDDITFEQGPFERLTGVGTIRILSHDRSDPDLVLRGIEHVSEVARLLDDARLAERRRRGLHVEQI
jgi:membrane protein YdbS with pleckstrin-like domain